ncbi:MAG: methyltransferase [Treponema sp.]|jgi:23S rRNA (uracil1939-C5)-methyltransferase|nr:methyltransferase [Treponema sp.]
MVIGEIFTAPVERIAAGGAGILTYQGQRVFMAYTAPGDMVTGRITGEQRDWAEAELMEIREPAPQRVPPVCPQYERCGGCSLQHLAYTAQIAAKVHILQDAFTRIGGFSPAPKPKIRQSPFFEYRNRMQLHYTIQPSPGTQPHGPYRFRGARPALGLKARNSETIIPVTDCPMADPGIRQALHQKSLVPPPEKDRFTVYARLNTFLSEGGKSRGTVPILDRNMLMDAGVFFQSNGIMLEALIEDLVQRAGEADPSRPMADLYCGVGTFAAFLQDRFAHIDMVEENKAALNLARENVRGKGMQYAPLSCDQWIKQGGNRGMRDYGFIVMDPPRQGLSPALRHRLSVAGPPLLVYVSCNPATLARDSRELSAGGYGLEDLTMYDFYPQTAHIESMAVFRKPGTLHG